MQRIAAVVAVAGALCGAAAPASASADTLYVTKNDPTCSDTGPGTATQPFCSISAAAARVGAGQTVRVAGGTYNERVSLASSGTALAPIVFEAASGETVTLTGQTNGFYTNGKAYVTIQGFTVAGTTQDGIVVSKNSSHITVRGNEVLNCGLPISLATSGRGIRVDQTSDNVIADNKVHENTDYGIYVVGGSSRNLITGNEVYGNARQFERAAAGIRIHGSANNTISGNTSYDNEDSGIELVTGAQSNLVVNNVVYDNGDHGIDDTGNSPNNSVIGNTVYKNVTAGIDFEGGATGSVIYNNLAVDNGVNSPRTKGNIRVDPTSTSGTSMDYNLVYLTAPGRNYEWGIGYDTLFQMQLASGQEIHSIEADPAWTSPSTADFTLQAGSPAIDSANSGVAGAASSDAIGTARKDDPVTADTGVGPRTYDDRGPLEYVPHDRAPTAALATTPNAGAIDLEVTADASASSDNDGLSPIATYTFDWDDDPAAPAVSQTTPTAEHTYTEPGRYDVTVTVTDTAGLSSSRTSAVTVTDDPPTAVLSLAPAWGPAPLTTTADASASTDADATPIASYSFDWGDGTAPTGPQSSPQATHTYPDVGTYTVTLTVEDTAGNRASEQAEVRPYGDNAPPMPALSMSPSSGQVDLAVTADATGSTDSDDGIESYSFDWGDDSPATGPQEAATATHTYRRAGRYVATVTVTDHGGGSSKATAQVTVTDPAPAAHLTVSPSSGLAPLDVTADASASTDEDATPIASYSFDWGDGSPATGPQASATATHTYTIAGAYTVRVTATDTAGQVGTVRAQVVATSNMVGNPGFESSSTGWNTSGSVAGTTLTRVAGGHSGDFSAEIANGSPGTGACGLNDAPDWIRPTQAGTYTYSIWIRGSTTGPTIKLRVTEFSGGVNVGSAIVSRQLTTSWEKLTLSYTTKAPGSSLDWNTFIANAPPGTCFWADDAAIEAPGDREPSAALTVTPDGGAIDLDVTADASASSDEDGLSPIASYRFDWGDGSAFTGPQPDATATHTYRAAGTYTVWVRVRDTAGLYSEAPFTVTVRDDPPAAALSVWPSSGKAPLQISADASASTDVDATPIASYSFDWGDGSPVTEQSSPDATHVYTEVGTHTLVVTVRDTAGQASQSSVEIRVFGDDAPPTAALSVSPISGVAPIDVTADASASSDPGGGIAGYSFDWGDGTAPTGQQSQPTATHTYAAAGSYTVTVTVTDTKGQQSTSTAQVTASPNLVGNPGFESSSTGWNTSGSLAGVTLTRVTDSHSGGWAAKLANTSSGSGTCTLNDAPDWVKPSAAGSYAYSIWVRGDTAGATIKARVTEWSAGVNVGSAIVQAELTTSWKKLSLEYSPKALGSSLDFNTYVIGAPPGTCFYADDATIGAA